MKTINIGHITDLISSHFSQFAYTDVIVLADENTRKHCYPLVREALPDHKLIIIKAGEEYKSMETCMLVWAELSRFSADRKSCLVNLGGGMISDLGGFCASTFKRGIPFVNIPTTLLGMTDAAIGGKTGVDFQKWKNHIGVFQPSKAVLIDPVFLKTLDDRNIVSGAAETIKHALIAPMVVDTIFENVAKRSFTVDFIEPSVRFKQSIVEQDALEHGDRKILNFGHTVGHSVESYFLDKPELLLHGEAIIMGMIAELFLSSQTLGFPIDEVQRLAVKLNRVFTFRMLTEEEIWEIAGISKQDKKNAAQQIQAVLLKEIGKPVLDVVITEKDIYGSLAFYNECLEKA